MKRGYLKAGIICFILTMMLNTVRGQSTLERISVTERSGGLGYVTRFHLNAPVDSSAYIRNAPHYVQLKLYGVDLETEQFRSLESDIYDIYTDIVINRIDQNSFGIELFLEPSAPFLTEFYPDVNGTDLLLSLTNSDENSVRDSISEALFLFEPTVGDSVGNTISQKPDSVPMEDGADNMGKEENESEAGGFLNANDSGSMNRDRDDANVLNTYSANNTFSPEDEYYLRLLQILGISDHSSSYNIRPVMEVQVTDIKHPWDEYYGRPASSSSDNRKGFEPSVKPYQLSLFQSYNSRVPRGNNDGAVWQGRGHNVAFSAGFEASAGPLKIRLRPVVGSAQNREFDLGRLPIPFISYPEINYLEPASIYAYRGADRVRARIDHVQRYGDSRYSWADLGESAIELNYNSMRLALSNEKIWMGPAHNTSLLLGYSAPGFNHLYAGTNRPAQTPIGSFEFAYIFGKMVKSDYFDTIDYRNSQSINAFLLSFSPKFAKKRFSIGAVRAYFFPYPKSFSEYRKQASKLYETPLKDSRGYVDGSGAVNDNQIAILFSRYVVPSSGFEMYIEYGRNDHNSNFRDLLGQPSHHRAYSVGMTKAKQISENRIVAVNLEINQLEPTRTTVTRGGRTIFNTYQGGWYLHSNQIMGISNRGQIPGTGYGVGINMQQMKVDLFHNEGKYGLKLARIAYHNAYLNENFNQILQFNNEDIQRWEVRKIELLAGVEATFFQLKNLEISATIEQSITFNNNYIKGNDINNTRFELVLKTNFKDWKR